MTDLKVTLLLLVLVCLVAVNNSQLTFTPTWGKRDPGSAAASLAAATAAGGGGNPQMIPSSVYATSENNCKASMDSMLIIYRLIQAEAQRILACNGK